VSKQQLALEEVARDLERTSNAAGQAAIAMQRVFAEIETAIGGGQLLSNVQNVERATGRTESLVKVLVAASHDLRESATSEDS
jgi:hypothetical protein